MTYIYIYRLSNINIYIYNIYQISNIIYHKSYIYQPAFIPITLCWAAGTAKSVDCASTTGAAEQRRKNSGPTPPQSRTLRGLDVDAMYVGRPPYTLISTDLYRHMYTYTHTYKERASLFLVAHMYGKNVNKQNKYIHKLIYTL